MAILGGDWDIGRPVRPVIRPGGYATHDSKMYTDSGPFGVRAPMDTYPALRPALTLWSYVVSRPEPDLALLGFGKRDGSYDVDLPMPETLRRDGETHDVDGALHIFELNDQQRLRAQSRPASTSASATRSAAASATPAPRFEPLARPPRHRRRPQHRRRSTHLL